MNTSAFRSSSRLTPVLCHWSAEFTLRKCLCSVTKEMGHKMKPMYYEKTPFFKKTEHYIYIVKQTSFHHFHRTKFSRNPHFALTKVTPWMVKPSGKIFAFDRQVYKTRAQSVGGFWFEVFPSFLPTYTWHLFQAFFQKHSSHHNSL